MAYVADKVHRSSSPNKTHIVNRLEKYSFQEPVKKCANIMQEKLLSFLHYFFYHPICIRMNLEQPYLLNLSNKNNFKRNGKEEKR